MYPQEFVSLVMGDRSIYPVSFDKGDIENVSTVDHVAKELLDHGYTISNLLDMKKVYPEQLMEFLQAFEPDEKAGWILRKGFADSKEFKDYSEEEWNVIFAQYSLTYGWSDSYQRHYGNDAIDVMQAYNTEGVEQIEKIMEDSKTITIGFRKDVVKLIKEILQSPVVLRAHQLKTLLACPEDVLLEAFKKSNITIRETLITAIKLLRETGISGLFKFPTDVLRYILAVHARNPFQGQITKPDLKERKVTIPTKDRKFLLKELENMGTPKQICEDMFTYESYWKLMHRYLRFNKAINARKRFPNYHDAIDLLYKGDRSWTFNGRYSAALANMDYALALGVAQERTGFLMRNFMNFLRYPVGTKVAQSIQSDRTASLDPMQTASVDNTVLTDDIAFFFTTRFADLIAKSNPKLAFQLLEQLQSKSILRAQSTRTVQGITKHYSTPIPGVKKQIAKKVATVIESGIRLNLQKRNRNVGMVYISPELEDGSLQYSGRKSTELNYSGSMLTPGSKIDIPDTEILRVGVLWRGQSTDIDHSASLFSGNTKIIDVYFGHPTYKDLVNSSGDITSCGPKNFSAEFIDIDMQKVLDSDITSIITSLISYTGHPHTIGKVECYLFIKGISKAERIIAGRQFKIDLMDTDYATRLDPDNVENSTSYVGFNIQLDEGKIQVCAYTPKEVDAYTTVRSRIWTPEFLEGIFGTGYSLYNALHLAFASGQITLDEDKADLIFGPNGIDPSTELETIQKYIF